MALFFSLQRNQGGFLHRLISHACFLKVTVKHMSLTEGTLMTALYPTLKTVCVLLRETHAQHTVLEKLRREDVPEYPVSAIREAITNAVMHRDWFIEGANVFVEIYSDRIIISSPGSLPAGMLPKDLGHKSVRRNPLIAEMLHRIGLIEKAGTGITRMRRDAKEKGYPEPEFSADNFFDVIFRPIDLESEIGPVNPVKRMGSGEDHDEDHDEREIQITQTEYHLLESCMEDAKNQREMLKILDYSRRTGNFINSVKHLLELGLLEMTIPDKPRSKNQKYRITESGRDFLKRSD